MMRGVSFLGHQLLVDESIKWSIFFKELSIVRVVDTREDSFKETFTFVFVDRILKRKLFFFSRLSLLRSCRACSSWYTPERTASRA